jgi:hypothetical protein
MPALCRLDLGPVRLRGRRHDRHLHADRPAASPRNLPSVQPSREPGGAHQAEGDVPIAHAEPALVPERIDARRGVAQPAPTERLIELARNGIEDAVEVGPDLERGEANVVTGVGHEDHVARAHALDETRREASGAESAAEA